MEDEDKNKHASMYLLAQQCDANLYAELLGFVHSLCVVLGVDLTIHPRENAAAALVRAKELMELKQVGGKDT